MLGSFVTLDYFSDKEIGYVALSNIQEFEMCKNLKPQKDLL